ncbi:MAG TPA: DUF899 family protein [Streptosporangiaceae bacterium]|nr:DUF899 family protein [Streptosporangiaceae bacterium]
MGLAGRRAGRVWRAADEVRRPGNICAKTATALPPAVDAATWQRELGALRIREKAATCGLDAIAARRRRLPLAARSAPA